MIELSIVLPAYKEAASLATLLPRLKDAAATLTPDHEIIVVDAQEPVDKTREICAQQGVRHVHRTGGNTYGDAVRTGIATATGTRVLFMDADGSHNPDCLAALWAKRDEFDVVIGSRYTEGGATENPLVLIFMSWVVNVTFRVCFGLKAKDVTNSLRLYPGAMLRAERLVSNNFDIVEEILIHLCGKRHRARVVEVPVTFERRKAGESKRDLMSFAITYVATIVRLMSIKFRMRD
jgi:dolichol-phosphate mannosyltransferase